MSQRFGILALVGALMLVTADARAQGQAGTTVPDEKPATATILGDTGLWFVPAGEVLQDKDWSVSAYRINWDVAQGFTDVSHFAVNFAYGLKDRAELFGSIRFDTRIDRDTRPIFGVGGSKYGGVDNSYPFVDQGWIGDKFGDVFLGAKVNLLSESRNQPLAAAVRGAVKLPTGSKENQSGTGKADVLFDVILSKEVAKVVEVSGTAGYVHRGDPAEFDLSDSFRWGLGAQFPTRSPLTFTTEVFGEQFSEDAVVRKVPAVAPLDLSAIPEFSDLPSVVTMNVGATWHTRRGIFFGGGLNWSAKAEDRAAAGVDSDDNTGTKFGWQFRVGYHPPVAARPVPAPPPPPPPPAPEHALTLTAQCNPCTVEVGQVSQVTAAAVDSIGCAITYRWSAPSGTFANAAEQNTAWTAPDQVGTVTLTVAGTCPSDQKTASATVNIQVTQRAVRTFTFEDVYFDFDRYTLTDAATRILSESVATLRANPELRIRIEGHTCSIGTAEYNLALGDRRARSVLQYLVSNGIAADRLTTVSFGEENPKHDNSREETRRLNRRAALTVQIVAGN